VSGDGKVRPAPFCRAAEQGARCGDPAPYVTTFLSCPWCINRGLLACIGHPTCEEHTLTLRGGKWKTSIPDTLLDGLDVDPSGVVAVSPRRSRPGGLS